MTVTYEDLVATATFEESEQSIYDILTGLEFPVTGWAGGGRIRSIISAVARMNSAFAALMSNIAKSAFREYATGDWLTLVAKQVYNVDRIEATFATGYVTLTNSGGGTYSESIGDVIVRNSTTNKTYRNTEAFTLSPHSTATVAVEAIEVGAASTSATGMVDEMTTTLIGVTVSNAAPIVGQDAESDALLRVRAGNKLYSLSPDGPREAYEYVATTCTDASGVPIGCTRVHVVPSDTGDLTVYCASAQGGITGNVNLPGTDLYQINRAIQFSVVPLGIGVVTVESAQVLQKSITYSVYILSSNGYTEAEVNALIYDPTVSPPTGALARFFSDANTCPIGGHDGVIYRDAIISAIFAVSEDITEVLLLDPVSGNISVSESQVVVLGAVSGSVYKVDE